MTKATPTKVVARPQPFLVPGEIHFITDFYGDLGFEAAYVGVAESSEFTTDDEILVFERVKYDETVHRFAGVKPEVAFAKDPQTGHTNIYFHLRASFYGKSVRDLKHVNQRPIPKFSMAE